MDCIKYNDIYLTQVMYIGLFYSYVCWTYISVNEVFHTWSITVAYKLFFTLEQTFVLRFLSRVTQNVVVHKGIGSLNIINTKL